MKKTLLVMLMVAIMIATPCLAEEMISSLSVEGTAWKVLQIHDLEIPSIFAFNNNLVYCCAGARENWQIIISNCEKCETSHYTNYNLYSSFNCKVSSYPGVTQVRGIVLPAVGFGWLISRWCDNGCLYYFRLINKINDNWTPPEVE